MYLNNNQLTGREPFYVPKFLLELPRYQSICIYVLSMSCFILLLFHAYIYYFCFLLYNVFFFNLLSLVHFVAVMAILGLKMPSPCEHLHLVPQYPFVMSTLDDTKIMKFISLSLQCERVLTVSLIFSLFLFGTNTFNLFTFNILSD